MISRLQLEPPQMFLFRWESKGCCPSYDLIAVAEDPDQAREKLRCRFPSNADPFLERFAAEDRDRYERLLQNEPVRLPIRDAALIIEGGG